MNKKANFEYVPVVEKTSILVSDIPGVTNNGKRPEV